MEAKELTGKTALITGGGSGIGKAIAVEFARAGARVAVTSRNLANLDDTVAEIEDLGGQALAVAANVVEMAEVDALYKEVIAKFGAVDVLVNGSGGSARERSSLFCESAPDVWHDVIALNYTGVLNVTRAVVNGMIERRAGRIINISSLDGMIGAAGRADYSGAKAAVIGFSKALAKELAGHNVTVNCISPGPIVSGYDEIMLTSDRPEAQAWADQMAAVTGFGYGAKDDISAMALFLASNRSKFISGQNIPICGLANINPGW